MSPGPNQWVRIWGIHVGPLSTWLCILRYIQLLGLAVIIFKVITFMMRSRQEPKFLRDGSQLFNFYENTKIRLDIDLILASCRWLSNILEASVAELHRQPSPPVERKPCVPAAQQICTALDMVLYIFYHYSLIKSMLQNKQEILIHLLQIWLICSLSFFLCVLLQAVIFSNLCQLDYVEGRKGRERKRYERKIKDRKEIARKGPLECPLLLPPF